MTDLLRRRLGFRGVSITDAMDMRALAQGSAQIVDAIMALRAGVDLLLLTPDRAASRRLEAALEQATRRGLVAAGTLAASERRVLRLRRWLTRFERPTLAVVRCAEHEALAGRAAAAAITLVRDDDGLLPLRPAPGTRVLVVTPQPRDLTPADSSSTEPLDLAAAIRRFHPATHALRVAAEPEDAEIAAVRAAAASCSLVVVGTIATGSQPAQARLLSALLDTGTPLVSVALRTPYDLVDYPAARTHLCTYAIVPAALAALADALFGRVPIRGRLPVPLPGLYPRGHGLRSAGDGR
jgi:beta-N-acetylhexosaminidase